MAAFQEKMEQILQGIENIVVYLDDNTVTGPARKAHLKHLREVLDRFRKHNLRVKKQKCEFLKKKIDFLGHELDAESIRPSSKKLLALEKMPEPENIKQLETFIGLVNYYVLLSHDDPRKPIVLATDASEYGIGAVLYHREPDNTEKIIANATRKLTKVEINYAQVEKEPIGIIFGAEKFRPFLLGRKFTLLTDHQPLLRIFGKNQAPSAIAMKRLTPRIHIAFRESVLPIPSA